MGSLMRSLPVFSPRPSHVDLDREHLLGARAGYCVSLIDVLGYLNARLDAGTHVGPSFSRSPRGVPRGSTRCPHFEASRFVRRLDEQTALADATTRSGRGRSPGR
jgi:hypothetical protein